MGFEQYVPNVHFEQIPIKNLVSNQEYQRNLSQLHIKRTADHFDLYQINPVKVSRRNGINYVINGQHTIEIVAEVSGSRDTPVWCMVYDDLEYQQEADVFANQQKYVKKLLPYEIFMANVEAGNDKQLIIKALVESFDLRISSNSRPGAVCCIATLEDIYNKYGYDVLQRVLRLCVITWEGEPDSLSSGYLRGIIPADLRIRRRIKGRYLQRKSRSLFGQRNQPHRQRAQSRFYRVCRSDAAPI